MSEPVPAWQAVHREAGGAEATARVKRIVDGECVTEVDFVGALASVGGALPSRRLAVGHAVSQ